MICPKAHFMVLSKTLWFGVFSVSPI
jgi:hypothetical protein